MHQYELAQQLRDAFLAGYAHERATGKELWLLTPEERAKFAEVEAAAYQWARARVSILMVHATL